MFLLTLVFWQLLLLDAYPVATVGGGRWELLLPNIGSTAMHMQLLQNDRVIIFDCTDFGQSNLSLPNGRMETRPQGVSSQGGLAQLTPLNMMWLRTPLGLFLSRLIFGVLQGTVMPNGQFVQTGGFNNGEMSVRVFKPCPTCNWEEIENRLAAQRWYATNHILPDGRGQIIIETINLDQKQENNLYPFVFLNLDGHFLVFVNNRAVLFDYKNNKFMKRFLEIPGGNPKSYKYWLGSAIALKD
uniref:Glyoxal oxidase N-terminal domain-containing protein n=1 Tax=Fagus sylvatica TaxID=28930 RepID=A0A2N9I453_FAGSY